MLRNEIMRPNDWAVDEKYSTMKVVKTERFISSAAVGGRC